MADVVTLDKAFNSLLELIKTKFAPVRVASHSGDFTPDSIARLAVKTPALIVSCLGVSDVTASPQGLDVLMRMSAFLVVGSDRDKEGKKVDRDLTVLALASSVLGFLDQAKDFPACFDPPENIEADNLFSPKANLALWAVTWDQPVHLGASASLASLLGEFLQAGVVWDTAPPDGVPEAVDDFKVYQGG